MTMHHLVELRSTQFLGMLTHKGLVRLLLDVLAAVNVTTKGGLNGMSEV